MLTRRQVLLASAISANAALPAFAQPRHPTPQKPGAAGAHGTLKDAATGSPADTPLGPKPVS